MFLYSHSTLFPSFSVCNGYVNGQSKREGGRGDTLTILSDRIDKSMNGKGKREGVHGVTYTHRWKNNEDGERLEKWRTGLIRGSTIQCDWRFSKIHSIHHYSFGLSYLLDEIVVER